MAPFVVLNKLLPNDLVCWKKREELLEEEVDEFVGEEEESVATVFNTSLLLAGRGDLKEGGLAEGRAGAKEVVISLEA